MLYKIGHMIFLASIEDVSLSIIQTVFVIMVYNGKVERTYQQRVL